MKTPVEWLFDKLWDTPKDKFEWYLLRERALKIEKERMKDAWEDGKHSFSSRSAEDFYKETFDIDQ